MNLRQRIKLRYNNNRACNANIGAAIGNIVQQMEEIRYIVHYRGVPFYKLLLCKKANKYDVTSDIFQFCYLDIMSTYANSLDI